MVVYIKDLVVEARHGLHPHEKEQAQRFNINVELTVSDVAATSDDINDTFDWSELRDKIVGVTQKNSFNLIERLAQEIANQILNDKRIKKVLVSVDKLDAFPNGTPGVRLELSN